MARPRKPTALHIVQNTGKKHPERMRARKDEPVPTGAIGAAPKHLSAKEKLIWAEIIAVVPPGVLANSDRIALEMAVKLIQEFRTYGAAWPAQRMSNLRGLLGSFGLTPADRSKIGVPKGKGKNPFGGF